MSFTNDQTFGARLHTFIQQSGLSIHAVAVRAKIKKENLYGYLRRGTVPKNQALATLAYALNLTPQDLRRKPGKIRPRDLTAPTRLLPPQPSAAEELQALVQDLPDQDLWALLRIATKLTTTHGDDRDLLLTIGRLCREQDSLSAVVKIR